MKALGKNGTILKDHNKKNFQKGTENSLPSKFCLFWEYSDLTESSMEWRDSSLIHIKVINLCNHQLSIMKKYSKPPIKNPPLYSFYPQVLILFQMFKSLLKKKDFQETNSSIFLWVKVCKKKQTFIFQPLPTEVIGWCFKIAIYCLLGWKTTLKSSYKLSVNQTKTSDFG